MSLIMSASGFPCIEGDFTSPVHFWEEERKQAESDRRIAGFLSCYFLESLSARHAYPTSALFDEFPSTPRPSWQQPPLCSSSLKKPAPIIPRSFDPSVAYTEPGKLQMPRSPASVPDLCFTSRSSLPKEGVSFLLSSSRASCKVMRVASEIRPLVLVHTSVVIE